MGHPGAEIARFLGVTTSAVVRAARSEDLQELQEYLQVHKFIQKHRPVSHIQKIK